MNREFFQFYFENMSGFQSMFPFQYGSYHGMLAAESGYHYVRDDVARQSIWLAVQPFQYSDQIYILIYNFIEGDTETEALYERVASTLRYADGWVGDGLLDIDA